MKRRRLSKLRYGRMEERRMLAFVDPGFSGSMVFRLMRLSLLPKTAVNLAIALLAVTRGL